MNRKTPKEIIERGNPKTEQAYIKFPREELINISKKESENSVEKDIKLMLGKIIEQKGNKKYFLRVHTHPYENGDEMMALPSSVDLSSLKKCMDEIEYTKGEVIAQRDKGTGEVQGYTFLLKGIKEKPDKKNWLFGFNLFHENLLNYQKTLSKDINQGYNKLKKICEKQNWNLRFVPAKGYYFNKETGNFEKKGGIEKIISSLIGVSIFTILLSGIARLTGFSISNVENPKITSIIIVFAFILLITCYFIIKQRRLK